MAGKLLVSRPISIIFFICSSGIRPFHFESTSIRTIQVIFFPQHTQVGSRYIHSLCAKYINDDNHNIQICQPLGATFRARRSFTTTVFRSSTPSASQSRPCEVLTNIIHRPFLWSISFFPPAQTPHFHLPSKH